MPLTEGLCKSLRCFAHTEGASQRPYIKGGFVKPIGASYKYIHTYVHFGLSPYRYLGAS